MTKLHKIAAAISLVGLSASVPLHAQTTGSAGNGSDYNPSWYVAPSLNAIDPDSRFTEKNGPGAGVRFGKPISESWDIQLGTSYARSKDGPVRYQQNLLGVDALYLFSRQAFRPFLLIGTGYQRDKLDTALGRATHSAPYIEAGVGAQVSLSDRWSLQADYRRVHGYLRDNTFGFNRSNNNYLTVGLNYALEKPAPAVVEQPAPPPVAEQAPEPAPAPVAKPAPHFEKVTLSATELFGFNSDVLQPAQPRLDEIAKALNADTSITNIEITGYADRLGSKKYNQKLSERRAVAVKNYLMGKGVDATRLNAEGRGQANPVVVCNDKKRSALIECLAPNRRVEVEQITIERQVQ